MRAPHHHTAGAKADEPATLVASFPVTDETARLEYEFQMNKLLTPDIELRRRAWHPDYD